MADYAFRYLAEENLVTNENLAHLRRTFELPIDEAESLTDDELLVEHGPTGSAIAAALAMKFEPAIQGGSPITVISVVEYGFLMH